MFFNLFFNFCICGNVSLIIFFFLHLAYLHVFMFCNFEINRQIVDKLSHNRFTSCTDLRITRIQKHRKNIYFSSFFSFFL